MARVMHKYDVFLCHNSQDKPAVEELARWLVKEGIQPWLDKWNLIPGEPWQEAIEEALDSCATCAVFIGLSGTGPWQNEEMRAAVQRRVDKRHAGERPFRVIPVLLPGAERGERGRLPAFLARTTWVEFRAGLDDDEAFRRLVAGIRGIPPGRHEGEVVYEDVCPYRGLQVFEEEHARFFFGREAATEWLVNELRAGRFLAVLGPSGSGKSSLVRAGLVPALRCGALPGSDNWPLCVFRPGHRPLESLAVALTQLLGPTEDPAALSRLMDALAADRRQLHLTARLALADVPADRYVALVVDQFEEIFTLCSNGEQRGPFIDNLLYASAIEGGRTMVVLTMRADFYGKCAVYPGLAARITDHQMLVSPMVEEELRQAIEQPARSVGLEFEGGLVETLLRDVQAEPGALPLLQHTLLELWERREGRRLTFAAYGEIGGVQGAIAHWAESIYAGFGATQQAITRRVMLRLTKPGEGTEDTRRRARKSELLPPGEHAEATEAVIQTLTDARLVTMARDMTTGEEQVDVSHETLIRSWPRLRGWINEDRAALRLHHRLTETAREWEESNYNESYLYRGTRLAEVLEWRKTHLNELNELESEFLEASQEGRDAILANTSDAIIITDAEGNLLQANPAAGQVFHSLKGAQGQPIEALLADAPEAARQLFTVPLESKDAVLTYQLALPDSRVLYASVCAVSQQRGQAAGRVAVLRDITHLKELGQMESDLVDTVWHGLRSPLTFVRGYITMIPMVGEVSPKQQEFVDKIAAEVDQMANLIGDLLDIGRIEAGVDVDMAPCQVDDLVRDVVQDLRPRAIAKKLELTTRLPGAPVPPVWGDRLLLQHALTNLVDNAIKYTFEGSVTVGLTKQNSQVVVWVKDTGIGIEAAHLPHLFEKFYRIKRLETIKIKGTGLGLAIVKFVAGLHKGKVWVESKPGQGSTFFLAVPEHALD